MALSYDQSAALMGDTAFRGRVKVSCMKYADYILLEAASTPAHNTRYKWAQATMINPDGSAATVTPTVVMDPAVQASSAGDGTDINDADLQSATENAINKML